MPVRPFVIPAGITPFVIPAGIAPFAISAALKRRLREAGIAHRTRCAIIMCLLLAACGSTESGDMRDDSGALLPDTATANGVLVMRHAADAFDRAPQWSLDTVPLVIIDGGEAFDLSDTRDVVMLSDGRAVALRAFNEAGLMLFDTTGAPLRLLAGHGEGPGELGGPVSLVVLPGDTLVVADMAAQRINWFTPDSGLVQSTRMTEVFPGYCYRPGGMLPDRRLVAVGGCSSNRRLPDGTLRAETPLVAYGLDYASADTVAMVHGSRMRMIEIDQNGQRFPVMTWLQLGQPTTVAVVDSTIVVGSGDGGYAIELLRSTGEQFGRIVVDVPPRLVDDALRGRQIDAQMEQRSAAATDPGTIAAIRRQVIAETPIADTVAAYAQVMTDTEGRIWAASLLTPGDSTWSATAFRRDGAIVARIQSTRALGYPVWFGADRVMLREVDADGVVRFGVYRIAGARPRPGR